MNEKRTAGFWVIIAAGSALLVLLLLGQTLSLVDYDLTVSIGLQESETVVGAMGVAMNRGFAVGDTIVYVPLLIVGLVGLWRRNMSGVVAMAGVFAITAYWPTVVLFVLLFGRGAPGFRFTDHAAYSVILVPFILYGLWGLWYLHRSHRTLVR